MSSTIIGMPSPYIDRARWPMTARYLEWLDVGYDPAEAEVLAQLDVQFSAELSAERNESPPF